MQTQENVTTQAKSTDYEQLIALLVGEVTNSILEFIIARQLTPEHLLSQNRERLDGLKTWIAERLAELPAPTPETPAVPD